MGAKTAAEKCKLILKFFGYTIAAIVGAFVCYAIPWILYYAGFKM